LSPTNYELMLAKPHLVAKRSGRDRLAFRFVPKKGLLQMSAGSTQIFFSNPLVVSISGTMGIFSLALPAFFGVVAPMMSAEA